MKTTNHPNYYKPTDQVDLDRYGIFDLDEFIESLKTHGLSDIFKQDTHISDHLGKTIIEQLECLCDGNRKIMSSISEKPLMANVIREALLLHAEAISKWAGITGTSYAQRLALRVDLFPGLWKNILKNTESIGVKFNNEGNIEAFKTFSYVVVLARSEMSPKTPFGFSVRTVYPDIRSEHAYPAGINLQKYITGTTSYTEGSPVKKAYLKHITACGQDVQLIRYDENKTHDFITFALPSDSNSSLICLMDQVRTVITKYDDKCDGDKTNFTSSETAQYFRYHPKYKTAENNIRFHINRHIGGL